MCEHLVVAADQGWGTWTGRDASGADGPRCAGISFCDTAGGIQDVKEQAQNRRYRIEPDRHECAAVTLTE